MKKIKSLTIVRNVIIILALVTGFIFWLNIPEKFNNGTMFFPGYNRYKDNILILPLIFLPLLALLKNKEALKVSNYKCEEEKEKLYEEKKIKSLKLQIVVALFESLIVFLCLLYEYLWL